MVKQEWKKLFHNTWMKVVLVALIAIPSIYACVFLGSMWDPYGNTQEIPVAVVNEDKEVIYNDKSLAVGDELVKNLESNDSMEFHFVNADEAMKGLEDGYYAMIITIPDDFSKNATTLLDDQPQKMVLNYTTNPGTNYVASKMDDSAMAKIKEEVSSSVTKTYAETIFSQIGVLSDGLNEASDGTSQLSDGMDQLTDGNQTLSDNLKLLSSSSLVFEDGMSTLSKGIKNYTDGVVEVHNGIYTLKDGLDTLNSSTDTLSTGIEQLAEGAESLESGITSYTNGVSEVQTGLNGDENTNPGLVNGISSYTAGVSQVQAGLNGDGKTNPGLVNGISSYTAGVNQVQAGLNGDGKTNPGLVNGISSYTAGVSQIQAGLNGDGKTNPGVVNGLKSYTAGVSTISTGLKQLNAVVAQSLAPGVQQLEAGVDQLNQTLDTAKKTSQKIIDGKQALDQQTQNIDFSQLSEEQIEALASSMSGEQLKSLLVGYQQLANGSEQLAQAIHSADTTELTNGVKALNDFINKEDKGLAASIKQLSDGAQALDENSETLLDGANQLQTGVNQLAQNNEILTTGASQLQAGVNALASNSTVLTKGASQLQTGVNQLAQNSETLTTGASQLQSGVNQLVGNNEALTNGTSQLQNGVDTLVSNNKSLTEGASALAEGTSTLNKQSPTLIGGIQALDTGAGQIYTGTSTLVSNNKTLLDGSSALNSGASQISDGTKQLADGSVTLGEGLQEVKDGIVTLDDGIKDGAEKSKMSTTDLTYEMMSAPVETSHDEISKVENNGNAMAPYMMSVALYVCALAFTLMYPILENVESSESGLKYWLSKATVMYTVSTIAAVVMITCLIKINGLNPEQIGMTYLLAIVCAAAFMSIAALLTITTGYIGDFLLLVFMIINLGGSAGTYPLQTSGAIYKAIHPFVPYTYSVDGFRKVLSMANASIATELTVFVGIIIVCSILTVLYYQFKKNKNAHLIPQAFEKHE